MHILEREREGARESMSTSMESSEEETVVSATLVSKKWEFRVSACTRTTA